MVFGRLMGGCGERGGEGVSGAEIKVDIPIIFSLAIISAWSRSSLRRAEASDGSEDSGRSEFREVGGWVVVDREAVSESGSGNKGVQVGMLSWYDRFAAVSPHQGGVSGGVERSW